MKTLSHRDYRDLRCQCHYDWDSDTDDVPTVYKCDLKKYMLTHRNRTIVVEYFDPLLDNVTLEKRMTEDHIICPKCNYYKWEIITV
jgi:hypothetical protein